MDFVVKGFRPKGRPKRTWKEVVEGDMKSVKLRKEDALLYSKRRRLIRSTDEDSDDSVSHCFWYRLTCVILD